MNRKFNIETKNSAFKLIFFGAVLLVTLVLIIIPLNKSKFTISLFSACALDNLAGANLVEGTWTVPAFVEIAAQGWAGDPSREVKSSQIFVQLVDDENNVVKIVKKVSDFERPDVEKAFSNPIMRYTGFNFPLGTIEVPGDYSVLIGTEYEGQMEVCTVPFKLKVS